MCGTTANILIRGTACMAAAFALPAWAANGVVGPGNCNQAGFDSVLAAVDGSGGGTITFNCGTATIVFGLLAFNRLPEPEAYDVLAVMVFTVVGSIVLHGLIAPQLAARGRRLGLEA